MTENKLSTEEKCIPGTDVLSLYLYQGGTYFIFLGVTSKEQYGDILVFTTRHHTVFVDGDRRFRVQPYAGSAKHYFCIDAGTPFSQMRSQFGIWLQNIDRRLYRVENGQEPEFVSWMNDPELEESSLDNWWHRWARDHQITTY